MPNLIIVLTLFIGLFIGNKTGAIFGIIFGIIIDLNLGKTIGITSVLLAIIGLLGEYMDKNFSKDSRVTIIVMSAVSTIIYEVFTYVSIWRSTRNTYIYTYSTSGNIIQHNAYNYILSFNEKIRILFRRTI